MDSLKSKIDKELYPDEIFKPKVSKPFEDDPITSKPAKKPVIVSKKPEELLKLGYSANTLGLNRINKHSLKRFIIRSIIFLVIVMIAFGGYYRYESKHGYGVKTYNTNGVKFSIYFDKNAKF